MQRLKPQQGLSLIGLLIGLLISVLCILASLTLYKNLIRVATESKLDSDHDGQLAAAMLIVQLEVQSAGYRIPNAGANDIVEHVPAAGQRRLLWRLAADNGTVECRGLAEAPLDEDGVNYRVLRIITATTGCTTSAVLNTLTWNDGATLGRWRVVADNVANIGLDDYITTNNNTMFDFAFANVACNPYGANKTATTNHIQLTVTAPGSAFLQGAAGLAVNTYNYCLPNTYP